MPDNLTPEKRSKIMKSIKGKNTKPEKIIRSLLWKRGLRYRIHYKIAGRPDIVFRKKKLAIFIDGCFWHMCPKCFKMPRSNTEFWSKKLNRNVERDKEINQKLKNSDWIVLRFWEHDVLNNPIKLIEKIEENLFLVKKND